jgi:hypothetical protein
MKICTRNCVISESAGSRPPIRWGRHVHACQQPCYVALEALQGHLLIGRLSSEQCDALLLNGDLRLLFGDDALQSGKTQLLQPTFDRYRMIRHYLPCHVANGLPNVIRRTSIAGPCWAGLDHYVCQ